MTLSRRFVAAALAVAAISIGLHAADDLRDPRRSEPRRLASTLAGVPAHEYLAYFAAGIDGVFADSPDDAYAARVLFLLDRDPRLLRCLTGTAPRGGRRCGDIAP